jgi:hypothetical protein
MDFSENKKRKIINAVRVEISLVELHLEFNILEVYFAP